VELASVAQLEYLISEAQSKSQTKCLNCTLIYLIRTGLYANLQKYNLPTPTAIFDIK